jgi:glycosyl transferase family 2
MTAQVDVVTVYHQDENYELACDLQRALEKHETEVEFTFHGHDNRKINRGFGKGCNMGAQHGEAPVIAFLNPDLIVHGPMFEQVLATFAADPKCVITGEKFGKSDREYQKFWGCDDWVCGAALFVRRDFFRFVGGFDPIFVWGWEETDLIRKAQAEGYHATSISLPVEHDSPTENTVADAEYKNRHFDAGARLFFAKWKTRP